MNITIRRAKNEDIEILSKLSIDTFTESYAAMNTVENMALYINKNFQPAHIQDEINDSRNTLLLAVIDEVVVGYVKLSTVNQCAQLKGLSNIEMERLYVLKEYHEQKVGATLMSYCISHVIKNGFEILWLGVWSHNEKAITFYKRWGFEVFGEQIFQLGKDAQTDLLMKRKC